MQKGKGFLKSKMHVLCRVVDGGNFHTGKGLWTQILEAPVALFALFHDRGQEEFLQAMAESYQLDNSESANSTRDNTHTRPYTVAGIKDHTIVDIKAIQDLSLVSVGMPDLYELQRGAGLAHGVNGPVVSPAKQSS